MAILYDDDPSGPPRGQNSEPEAPPVVVPPERLSPDILRALILDFVTRDGTDYGVVEAGLETKITEVEKQLKRGEVLITYDAASETCNIVPAHELKR